MGITSITEPICLRADSALKGAGDAVWGCGSHYKVLSVLYCRCVTPRTHYPSCRLKPVRSGSPSLSVDPPPTLVLWQCCILTTVL